MSKNKRKEKTPAPPEETAPGPGARFWNFFASVKLSFVLFIALAVASVIGTLLPQKEPASVYLSHFGPGWGKLILTLGLDDAYHAPWFLLLLGLLVANLVVCSLERLPRVWKIVTRDPEKDLDRRRPAEHSFTLAGTPAEVAGAARKVLEGSLGRVREREKQGEVVLLAQKGAWSRLGVYVVHTSVLIIFAGAIVGGIWGFSGFINIQEGQTVDHVELDNGRVLPLGFKLRLDKFTLTTYPGQQIPSEYRSDVTFFKGEHKLKTYLIVNQPAHFEGIDFYQSSYGVAPARLKLRFTREGKSQVVELKHRQWTELPGGGQAGVMDIREDVNMGAMYHGPIARVAYQAQGQEPVVVAAFKAGAKIPARGPVKFEILEVKTVPYSGLQVKYDPGVWFIWVGCGLMVVGFFIAFYMSHRKVWIRLAPASAGRTRVEIAGSSNKNRAGLKRLMLRLAAKLKGEQ